MNYWIWTGDGDDIDLQAMSVPIVIQPQELRSILEKRAALEQQLAEAKQREIDRARLQVFASSALLADHVADMEQQLDEAKQREQDLLAALRPFVRADAPQDEDEIDDSNFWRTIAVTKEQHDAACAAIASVEEKP